MTDKVAIVGAGLVGSAWAIIFARAGREVVLFDQKPDQISDAIEMIGGNMKELVEFGLLDDADAALARIRPATSLADALDGAAYVQESVFEREDVKIAFYKEMDAVIGTDTIVGSSSSGIPASVFTENLGCSPRCLIAHPVNPPYVIPIVEIVPAPWTAKETVNKTAALMEEIGMEPVHLTREVDGFLINRLQGALLHEAFRLLEGGYATAEDIDKTVSEGLGRRWAFMGPFETIDLNAPLGLRDYCERLGPMYQKLAEQSGPPKAWGPEVVEKAHSPWRKKYAESEIKDRQAWRDKRLMALAAHLQAAKDDIGT
ncbi:MAG: 3-hydroxyacyl-CoA dehydrogenase [Alphaproteobacteria bacterium]|jgi:3-hydroxyacyl-CoA dehydrogenase|nr:3-hydroxyacyl-CoA dehydrogenase [Alphaproteobacteria bacterium]